MGVKSEQISEAGTEHKRTLSLRKQRKEDALEFARLLYSLYKKQKSDGKIVSGQNNANDPKEN